MSLIRLTASLRQKWEEVIGGERILELHDPKSVIDVMLGAIAIVSGTRNMDKYMMDLDSRGQSETRKREVLQTPRNAQSLTLTLILALTLLGGSKRTQGARRERGAPSDCLWWGGQA